MLQWFLQNNAQRSRSMVSGGGSSKKQLLLITAGFIRTLLCKYWAQRHCPQQEREESNKIQRLQNGNLSQLDSRGRSKLELCLTELFVTDWRHHSALAAARWVMTSRCTAAHCTQELLPCSRSSALRSCAWFVPRRAPCLHCCFQPPARTVSVLTDNI